LRKITNLEGRKGEVPPGGEGGGVTSIQGGGENIREKRKGTALDTGDKQAVEKASENKGSIPGSGGQRNNSNHPVTGISCLNGIRKKKIQESF